MTEAKSTRRRRRSTAAAPVPAVLAEWFSGRRMPRPNQSATPWLAMIYPHGDLLSMRWQSWKAENPAALPPPGWEWLDKAESKRHPNRIAVARALACLGRSPG